MEALTYARRHLPLDDPVLKNARFLNFEKKESADTSPLEYFSTRYPSLLPSNSDSEKMETLKDEFTSYQLLEARDVPASV